MNIIKTEYYIDGIEVTSEHIGKKLEVLKSDDSRWLPEGFVTTIKKVNETGVIDLQDTGGKSSLYGVDLTQEANYWEFKWVTPVNPKKSTKQVRQKLAKAIHNAKAVLDLAVSEAEEVGMVVNLHEDGVDITFNPPVEEY